MFSLEERQEMLEGVHRALSNYQDRVLPLKGLLVEVRP